MTNYRRTAPVDQQALWLEIEAVSGTLQEMASALFWIDEVSLQYGKHTPADLLRSGRVRLENKRYVVVRGNQ